MTLQSSAGSLESCHYDDTQRGTSLKRIKRLGEKCHHVRWVYFERFGVEAVVLFDAFCSSEVQPCAKDPCKDDVSIFIRQIPIDVFAGQVTANLELSSKDPDLLQFSHWENHQVRSSFKMRRSIWPPLTKQRDWWPIAISLNAVRFPQQRENHAPVSLRIEILDNQKLLDVRSFQMAFRIPRTGECGQGKPVKKEAPVGGVEMLAVTEALKLLLKDGYEFAKRALIPSEGIARYSMDEARPQIDLGFAAEIQKQLSQSQQKQLVALSQVYSTRNEALARRIIESADVRPGVNKVELEEDIERLKHELRRTALQINELLPR